MGRRWQSPKASIAIAAWMRAEIRWRSSDAAARARSICRKCSACIFGTASCTPLQTLHPALHTELWSRAPRRVRTTLWGFGPPSFFRAQLGYREFPLRRSFLAPIVIRMALGTASAGSIMARPDILVAITAGCNSRQQDVSSLATFRRPVVARRAGQQAVRIVVELGVQKPARRDGRLRHHGQRPISCNHDVTQLAPFVE